MDVFYWPVRVYYEDTDAGGVVYYANYLKFLERARTEWLREKGMSQQQFALEHQQLFVVSKVNIDFKRSAKLDDQLLVSVVIAKRSKIRCWFQQQITFEANQQLACQAEVEIACVDANSFRPQALPNFLKEE